MGTAENGLRARPAVRHARADKAGDHGLDRLLQPLTATFGAGLPQPGAVRTTLVGGAAKICRLMTGLCTPVFGDNLTSSSCRPLRSSRTLLFTETENQSQKVVLQFRFETARHTLRSNSFPRCRHVFIQHRKDVYPCQSLLLSSAASRWL